MISLEKLVTVIIPCYKNSNTLGRAVESVLSQTYSNVEIIVINDHSPESKEIFDCLKQYPSVKLHVNSENIGLASSRNKGIELANGQLIAFLDADDEYAPEKLELQVQAHKPGVAVTCAFEYVYSDGKRKSKISKDRIIGNVDRLLLRNTLNGAGILIEKELLLKFDGYESSLRSCEDWDLWLRLITGGVNVISLGKPLYYYYQNFDGLSKNYLNISQWENRVIQRQVKRSYKHWDRSYQYGLVCSIFIIRHFWRGTLSSDKQVLDFASSELAMLNKFIFLKWVVISILSLKIIDFVTFLMKLNQRLKQ